MQCLGHRMQLGVQRWPIGRHSRTALSRGKDDNLCDRPSGWRRGNCIYSDILNMGRRVHLSSMTQQPCTATTMCSRIVARVYVRRFIRHMSAFLPAAIMDTRMPN